ncbi:MAG: hypothetical protein ACLP5H_12800 [Desulfomonilaceae bacterium]
MSVPAFFASVFHSQNKHEAQVIRDSPTSLWIPLLILIAVWTLIVLIVNPVGEFMVNDDWAFVRALQTLTFEGRMPTTGWGPSWAPGGPSLIVHLLWGRLFTFFGGFSFTVLRISVLTLGILGSCALLVLLRSTGSSAWVALWGSLTLVVNPLFLSQSFTYMTDITFAGMVIFALCFLHAGVQRSSTPLLVLGLLFALFSILTRQLGVIIPLAFVTACFLHPSGKDIGRWKMVFLMALIDLAPWAAYEYFLYTIGSTPITQHQVFYNLLLYPQTRGFLAYLTFLYVRFFHAGLLYIGFLISPVLALKYRTFLEWKAFRYLFIFLTLAFLLFESALLMGLIDPPVYFFRNVIFNFGIGPILLKDTYILEITRAATIPKPLYYLILYWSILSLGALLGLMLSSLRRLLRTARGAAPQEIKFLPLFALFAGLMYLGVITPGGFHDRYLIPVCMFFIVWVVSDLEPNWDQSFNLRAMLGGLVPFLVLALFALLGTHDFMDMKRSLKKAQDYLVFQMNVQPCDIDGGLEFNGYHCYSPDFRPHKGLSWWWVRKEDYLITLGLLSGYQVVRTFPFKRCLGPDGAIFVLKPHETSGDTN